MSKHETPSLTHEEAMTTLNKVTRFSDLQLVRLYSCQMDQVKATKDEFQGKVSTFFRAFDGDEFGCLVEYTELAPLNSNLTSEDLKNEKPSIPAVRVVGAFEMRYNISEHDQFSEDEMKAFCRINAVFQSWPYWREFMPSMLARAGLPGVQVLRPMPVTLAAHIAGYPLSEEQLAGLDDD